MKQAMTAIVLLVAGLGVACSGGDASSAVTTEPGVAVSTMAATDTSAESARAAFSFEGTFRQGGVVRGHAPTGTRSLMLDDTAIPLTAEDGAFLIGFGRDHGPSATLVADLGGGQQLTEALTIAPTEWRIEHVNTSLRGGRSSAA